MHFVFYWFPAVLPVFVLSQVSLSVACAAIFFLLHLSKFDCCFTHQILIVEVPKYLISISVLLLTKMLVNLDLIPLCITPSETGVFPLWKFVHTEIIKSIIYCFLGRISSRNLCLTPPVFMQYYISNLLLEPNKHSLSNLVFSSFLCCCCPECLKP